MEKVLFGITSLTLGGAERVLVDLANELSKKYEITIFTIYSKGELEKQLSKNVKIKSLYNKKYLELNKMQKYLINPIKILLGKKKIYNKYIKQDYIAEIAFLEGPITRLFSIKNKNKKKIAWIHNDISQVFGKGIKSKIKKIIDKKIYRKYQKLVFVSKDNLEKFNEIYKDINVQKEVIYNYIDKENVLKKANKNEDIEFEFNNNIVNFVTVARLVKQKAIDRLINIHSKLIKNNYNHNFYVIGEGPEKENLEKIIKDQKVEKTFKLLGKKENPYPYIKNATYFCLMSKFEGYGMVIEEAKILNKPIIITDTAAREALRDYKNSKILNNNYEDIYLGLKNIIENYNKTKQINFESKNLEYDNKKIIKKIEELIGE